MRDQFRLPLFLCLVLALAILALSARMTRAPASAPGDTHAAPTAPAHHVQTGLASWYGRAWQGKRTASGERFDIRKLTAAHRHLPLNTRVRVTNLTNGRSVEVKINDRGPYAPQRVIDLSAEAAKQLDMTKKGLVPVKIETIETATNETRIAQR